MTSDLKESREEIEEAAATWIARRGGKWTLADATQLDAWLAESPGHRVAYYRLNAAWEQAGRLEVQASSSRNLYLAAAAAIVVLLAGAVVSVQMGLLRSSPKAQTQTNVVVQSSAAAAIVEAPVASAEPQEAAAPVAQSAFRQRYSTAIGASRVISLPDGSRVTLDTDSLVIVTIDEKARTVQLQRGQAFFEVAHDRQRPFVVDTGGLSVTAVGTAFSVRVGLNTRVAVAEGTVRLGRLGERDDLLPAGGIARLEGETLQIRLAQPAEVDRSLSWRSGVLTFRHTSLADAVTEFNRYGTRQIVIRDAQIAALELGGVFRSGDAEVFARLLERTFPIDADINSDRIELNARRSP